jgi:ribosomal protein S1
VKEDNKTYSGQVIRFESERNFGFVETENGESYFFRFDKKEQIENKKNGLIDRIHKFCPGDEVEFNIRSSTRTNTKLEAYNLKFIRNERREKLIDESNTSGILSGYLKLIDNEKFFVKHITTYVYVPIEISGWETDLEEVYSKRVNQLVHFSLINTAKINKLKAVLTDVRFVKEYDILKSALEDSTILKATITGKNSDGFFATVLNGEIQGFIPLNNIHELDIEIHHLKKGYPAQVKVKYIFPNKRVSLSLTT